MPTPSPGISESDTLKPSGQKRKSMASATRASTQPKNAKRIKTETTPTAEPTTEPIASKSGFVADSIYDVIVPIKVGEMEISFGIHRGLLCRESKFFREALGSTETAENGVSAQVIVLKDEDPETFRRFKDWLYSGRIISGSETYRSLAWSDIIAIYTFADRGRIPRLQNNCIDAIIQKRKEKGLFPGQADINPLWQASRKNFKLRRLVLDMFATGCNLQNAIANNRSYHSSFLQGLVQILYEMKEKQTIYDEVDFWGKRRDYYVVDDGNPILID